MFFKKDKSSNEKRQFQRKDLTLISYCKLDKNNNGLIECTVYNISKGGIFFEIPCSNICEGDSVIILYQIGTKIRKDKIIVKHIKKSFNTIKIGAYFFDTDHERNILIERLDTVCNASN